MTNGYPTSKSTKVVNDASKYVKIVNDLGVHELSDSLGITVACYDSPETAAKWLDDLQNKLALLPVTPETIQASNRLYEIYRVMTDNTL